MDQHLINLHDSEDCNPTIKQLITIALNRIPSSTLQHQHSICWKWYPNEHRQGIIMKIYLNDNQLQACILWTIPLDVFQTFSDLKKRNLFKLWIGIYIKFRSIHSKKTKSKLDSIPSHRNKI